MATRSIISVKIPGGGFRYIYCHYDGYLSHVGDILLKKYNDQNLVEELVRLGDISTLAPTLSGCEVLKDGKKDSSASNLQSFKDAVEDSMAEYVYLWVNGSWQYCDFCNDQFRFRSLTEKAIKQSSVE